MDGRRRGLRSGKQSLKFLWSCLKCQQLLLERPGGNNLCDRLDDLLEAIVHPCQLGLDLVVLGILSCSVPIQFNGEFRYMSLVARGRC
jgi:hypothetical protein